MSIIFMDRGFSTLPDPTTSMQKLAAQMQILIADYKQQVKQ